jgi:hypothetical protein
MAAVPVWGIALAFFLDLFRRRRKKARAAIRAMPMMGPTTAPAIQAFDFFFFLPPELGDDDGVGVVVITTPGDGAVVESSDLISVAVAGTLR